MQPNRASDLIRIVVWSLAGIVVVLALAFTVTATTLPGCTQCHRSPDFVAQTTKSAHADVACARCHVERGAGPRIAYAYHLIFGMVLHVSPVGRGSGGDIVNQTCLSCHAAVMTRIVRAKGLTIDHLKCSKGRMCTDCHSDIAHGTAVKWIRTSHMNQCLDCHGAEAVGSDCTKCHEERSVERRVLTGEWVVTHGPTWKQTHGMGDLKTCVACHPDNFCVRCHGISMPHEPNWLRTHPVWAASHRKDCAVCHEQSFCDACHGLKMPHPKGFTPTHPALVKQKGTEFCLRCHVQDDCTNCHIRHIHPGNARQSAAAASSGSGAK